MFWANEKLFLLVAWSPLVSTSFSRVKKLLKSWKKLLVLGLTVHCWEVPFVRSTNQSLEHSTKPQILRVSELFYLLNVTGFSKLVDYWKSLVLDTYWAKHFLVYTLPQFFTQPNLGFIKGRNEVILSWMCKAVLPFHLKYKLMIWHEGPQARAHYKCNVS